MISLFLSPPMSFSYHHRYSEVILATPGARIWEFRSRNTTSVEVSTDCFRKNESDASLGTVKVSCRTQSGSQKKRRLDRERTRFTVTLCIHMLWCFGIYFFLNSFKHKNLNPLKAGNRNSSVKWNLMLPAVVD